MPFPLVPVIAGAVSLISSAIASRSSKKQANATNKANMELAKYQTAANEEFIKQQNTYNSPTAQMARFSDAGLNPNLIYGQGSAGNQAAPNRYEAPRVDMHYNPFQIPDMLSGFQDYAMRNAQIDNVKAQTEATQTEIGNKLLNRMLTVVNTDRKQFDLEQERKMGQWNLDIKHGQSQQAYQKLLQEFTRTDLMNLQKKMAEQHVSQGDVRTEQMKAELLFSQFRNQWMKAGVTSADNPILRMIVRAMGADLPIQFNREKFEKDLHINDKD